MHSTVNTAAVKSVWHDVRDVVTASRAVRSKRDARSSYVFLQR
jgi:hypothetical protein